MYRIAICEDKEKYRTLIAGVIEDYCSRNAIDVQVDLFASGEEFTALGEDMRTCDIVFMDVEMEQMDGIEAAAEMRRISADTCLIFVTNYVKYAPDGYKVDALRYCLKDELLDVSIRESLRAAFREIRVQRAVHEFKFRDGKRQIRDADLMLVESDKHELRFQVRDGRKKQTWYMTGRLDEIEEELSDALYPFVRIQQSYLVNLDYIQTVSYGRVTMKDGKVLSTARDRYRKVKEQFLQYTETRN